MSAWNKLSKPRIEHDGMVPNIMLIVCDTLRKDILELYGGKARTPNLRKLAKDSVVYKNAVAPSPWTFPSHVSLFTGLYPSEHGVHETKKIKTAGCVELNRKLEAARLAEYLKSINYNTIGISNNFMVSRFTGFDIGFDHFMNIETDPWLANSKVEKVARMGISPIQIAIELMKQGRLEEIFRYTKEFAQIKERVRILNFPLDKGSKLTNNLVRNSKLAPSFFVFINYFEAHEPYRDENRKKRWENDLGIKPIDSDAVGHLKRQYVMEVEYLDEQIGELMEILKARDLYDDALLILTSDHGQALNEHGFLYHGIYLYDEITRVPLIIKYPKSKKFKKREGYQSLVNIFPLIKNILEGKDDKILTDRLAFSEAYGDEHIRKFVPRVYRNRIPYINRKYEKMRKTVYKDGFKLTINGSEGTIEEFMRNGAPASQEKNEAKVRELIGDVRSFSKEDDFIFPEI